MWSDNDLLQSLRCITKDPKSGDLVPTICGVVVFGKALALRRLFPMWRVDYIRVPSTRWVDDPDNRFISVEIRESLLHSMIRAEATILADIPKAFHLPEGSMQRQDIPLVPQRVIREALVNCLMHRNYAIHSPVQIIHYTDRIEFRNSGYSLAPEDTLGEPRSLPRNPSVATILHDLDFAETKGSGIRTMITLMTKHGLAPPAFNSDRHNNLFVATLLFHHFLDERDIEWLAQFDKFGLNDAQKKAMIFMRERDYIDNETYRRLNDVDTLEASQSLQYLRKKGLIEKEGKGNATHYKIVSTGKTHKLEAITHKLNGKTHMPETKTHKPDGKTHKPTLDELPEEIRLLISHLGKKSNTDQKINAILALCRWKALTAEEICSYLNKKDTREMMRKVLTPMINKDLLELTIPASRKHPHQKYRTKRFER